MSTARPVLIVEDDDASREALVDQLAVNGAWQQIETASLGEATQSLGSARARFDAVILDADLRASDGRDFCVQMRRQGHKMPVILVSRASEDANGVRGLDAEVSNYVSKPICAHDLLTRLRAQLRLLDNSVDAFSTVSPYTVHPPAEMLPRPEKRQRIPLINKEAELLKFFRPAENRIVLRQTLLDAAWGYSSGVIMHTPATNTYQVRRNVKAGPIACQLLTTQRGGHPPNAAGGVTQ